MPDYRLAAERAAKRYGIDPGVFLRQIQAESNFNPNAGSPAGAKGIAQIMPATARSYGVNLGDGKVSDDLDGAARLMRDALRKNGGDYKKALSVYNSGRPDGYLHFAETRAYVAKILGGGSTPQALAAQPSGAAVSQTNSAQGPAMTPTGATRNDLLKQYLTQRGQPGALLGLGTELGSLQSAPSPSAPVAQRSVVASPTSGTGQFKITGPNPGRLKPELVSFARAVSAQYGRPLTGSDGTGHSRLTTSGNVSQHTTGNATDIPSSGKELIRLGQAALIAAGMPPEQARKQTGGLYNVGSHQIIFATNQGGNHFDHLHISTR